MQIQFNVDVFMFKPVNVSLCYLNKEIKKCFFAPAVVIVSFYAVWS